MDIEYSTKMDHLENISGYNDDPSRFHLRVGGNDLILKMLLLKMEELHPGALGVRNTDTLFTQIECNKQSYLKISFEKFLSGTLTYGEIFSGVGKGFIYKSVFVMESIGDILDVVEFFSLKTK